MNIHCPLIMMRDQKISISFDFSWVYWQQAVLISLAGISIRIFDQTMFNSIDELTFRICQPEQTHLLHRRIIKINGPEHKLNRKSLIVYRINGSIEMRMSVKNCMSYVCMKCFRYLCVGHNNRQNNAFILTDVGLVHINRGTGALFDFWAEKRHEY